jgi:hypothetical protein
MSTASVIVLALLTGTHAATWGAFKDAPFEGFKVSSFVRTLALAVLAAALLATSTDLETTLAPVVLVGVLYAIERLATEAWKSFLREDDQSAYSIPMRVAVRGRTVDARTPRYLTGLLVLAGGVLVAWVTSLVQPADGGPLWLLVPVGGIGGWLTAAGGAWKDAPVEGFSGWKFLRSPVVATAWTVMLLPFTQDWVALTVAAAGLSVLSIETYKTFFTGGRPPGKFEGKPQRPAPQRDRCRLLHAGAYTGLACVTGLAALFDTAVGPREGTIPLVALTLVALTMAVLVGRRPAVPTPAVRRRLVPDAVPS